MPAAREAPSYSSTRVQRASRINSIEAARLLQQLQGLEKAKQHQCRLTNQDIRLVSLSLDYIQSSSGNSAEAWRPLDDAGDEPSESKPEVPCFLYGERIISRKMRRVQRPMSAVERVISGLPDDASVTSDVTSSSSRLKSSPGKPQRRPASVASFTRWRDSHCTDDVGDDATTETRPESTEFDRLSTASGGSSHPTPREAWENDTSPATKKILKAQALAQSGKRNSLYVSAGDVMTSQASRNVRHLARMIRVTSTPTMEAELARTPRSPSSRQNVLDKPPKRPQGAGRDSLGRRATIGEILNQHKPTLSAGAWRDHLNQSSVSPMSVSGQRQARLEVKKQLNECHKEEVERKVESFVRGHASPRWRRKSIFTSR